MADRIFSRINNCYHHLNGICGNESPQSNGKILSCVAIKPLFHNEEKNLILKV